LLLIPGILIGIAWYGFIVFYALLLCLGPLLTWLDAYSIYFLGGRYPMLGNLLDASTPALMLPRAYVAAAPLPSYPPPAPDAAPETPPT
jgi:hypothetical protein